MLTMNHRFPSLGLKAFSRSGSIPLVLPCLPLLLTTLSADTWAGHMPVSQCYSVGGQSSNSYNLLTPTCVPGMYQELCMPYLIYFSE